MSQPLISIIMACYNGTRFVSEQIDSLLQQTYTHWELIIRDDGSSDSTPLILNQYAKSYPDKIKILKDNLGNVGSVQNFNRLMQEAKQAEYVMLCDQDDKWQNDKIEVSFLRMKVLEQQYGKDCPLLFFTNFQYVDENMEVIRSKQSFEINRIPDFGFPHLLAQNPVYGCTCLMNRALLSKVGVIPSPVHSHDHWIALIAAAFGQLYYSPEKTVLYRQHTNNVSGNFNNNSFKKRLQRIVMERKNSQEVKDRYKMLLCFKEKYDIAIDQKQRLMLDNFLCFVSKKNVVCMIKSIQNKVRSQTPVQSLLMYATALFTKIQR